MVERIRIYDVDEISPRHETAISVELVSDAVTHQSPVILRIRLQNKSGDKREYLAGDGTRHVFSQVESANGTELVLVTRQQALQNGINLDDLPTNRRLQSLPFSGQLVLKLVTLSPGESLTVDLDIYGHPENTTPSLPLGVHRFEEKYEYKEFSGENSGEFDWGFSVQVQQKPDSW